MASVVRPGMTADWPRAATMEVRDRMSARRGGVPVELCSVSRSFEGRQVLRDVTLTIGSGQFVAIVGRSGTGKSTLLRIMAGLEQPSAGRTSIDGGNPARSAADLRMMFQDGRLLPWRTVRQNVALGLPSQAAARVDAALEAVGLADRAKDWPRILSGGQRQRVALARVLAASPRLVLLDEPLGALDALTRLEMQGLIAELWQQHAFTAVLVTHDVTEAVLLADRILLIEDGGIALDMAVDLPRPRMIGEPNCSAIERFVLSRLLQPQAAS